MNPLDSFDDAVQQGRISFGKTWFIRAIEQKSPRMTLELCQTVLYIYFEIDKALLTEPLYGISFNQN